jgi:hypothetical protein
VSSDVERFLGFLEAQRAAQAPRFASVQGGQVLAYMGTTSRPGTQAQVSVHRLREVRQGSAPNELAVRLAGALPWRPRDGECLSVHLTRPERYQGYQVKTAPLGPEGPGALFEEAEGEVTVKGRQLFTVHHSPYTLRFFERVPADEVQELCGEVRHALVAVGETANLSPRFVFHHEVKNGRLLLFHGDGLALKTWMNVRHNPRETRLLLDLDEGRGFALRGVVEPFAEADHPVAWQKVVDGFAAGAWGRPSRCFRLTVDSIEAIEPAG